MGQSDIIRELEKEDGLTSHELAERTGTGYRSVSTSCKTMFKNSEIHTKKEKHGSIWANRWYLGGEK